MKQTDEELERFLGPVGGFGQLVGFHGIRRGHDLQNLATPGEQVGPVEVAERLEVAAGCRLPP